MKSSIAKTFLSTFINSNTCCSFLTFFSLNTKDASFLLCSEWSLYFVVYCHTRTTIYSSTLQKAQHMYKQTKDKRITTFKIIVLAKRTNKDKQKDKRNRDKIWSLPETKSLSCIPLLLPLKRVIYELQKGGTRHKTNSWETEKKNIERRETIEFFSFGWTTRQEARCGSTCFTFTFLRSISLFS
jgi:HD superfamily phosphohydrolase